MNERYPSLHDMATTITDELIGLYESRIDALPIGDDDAEYVVDEIIHNVITYLESVRPS